MIGSILVTGDVLMRPVSLLFVRLPLTLSSQLTMDPIKDIKPLSAYLKLFRGYHVQLKRRTKLVLLTYEASK